MPKDTRGCRVKDALATLRNALREDHCESIPYPTNLEMAPPLQYVRSPILVEHVLSSDHDWTPQR
ncbi:MAG: hypothetical protein HUU08_08705 [Candidatus Brocadia sp.]|nr:hypothetical protein [Candidatus Brocadia sp.]